MGESYFSCKKNENYIIIMEKSVSVENRPVMRVSANLYTTRSTSILAILSLVRISMTSSTFTLLSECPKQTFFFYSLRLKDI